MNRQCALFAVAVIGILSPSCGSNPPPMPPVRSALLNPTGNVTLWVSNQSYYKTPVDIEVRIDGQVVVLDHFEVGNQHNFACYVLSLSPGMHRMSVRSERGAAEAQRDFVVTNRHWAYVEYTYQPWYATSPHPGMLECMFRDRPFQFQ